MDTTVISGGRFDLKKQAGTKCVHIQRSELAAVPSKIKPTFLHGFRVPLAINSFVIVIVWIKVRQQT